VADVAALDQTGEPAADASMIAFHENNTACTVDPSGRPDVQDTITCPQGTATTTDALDGSTWVHVFRLVKQRPAGHAAPSRRTRPTPDARGAPPQLAHG
jgi:hypothetical protein